MAQQTVIPGTTILKRLKLKDVLTGAWLPIRGFPWSSETLAGSGVTPAVPTITELDEHTALLRIDTVGLNGRSCRTRSLMTDPISSNVYGVDCDYLVKP